MRQLFAPLAALGAALLLGGCIVSDFGPFDRYQADFHYSYPLAPGGRVELDSFNGSVEINGWDQDKVEITGVKYASSQAALDSVRIDIRNDPNAVEIRTVRPSAPFTNAGARYAIMVPRKAALGSIETSNAAIRLNNVESGARLKTSNGAIRAGNLRGTIEARTSNGPIELRAVEGDCDTHTSNGSITVRIEGATPGQLKATTSNGPIDLTLEKAPAGGVRAQTSNGSITVRMPENTGARLEANTSNSSIDTELDVGGHAHGSTGARGHLDGTIGAGGPLIELGTHNGHIRLLRL